LPLHSDRPEGPCRPDLKPIHQVEPEQSIAVAAEQKIRTTIAVEVCRAGERPARANGTDHLRRHQLRPVQEVDRQHPIALAVEQQICTAVTVEVRHRLERPVHADGAELVHGKKLKPVHQVLPEHSSDIAEQQIAFGVAVEVAELRSDRRVALGVGNGRGRQQKDENRQAGQPACDLPRPVLHPN
jgi:hypothetical protein